MEAAELELVKDAGNGVTVGEVYRRHKEVLGPWDMWNSVLALAALHKGVIAEAIPLNSPLNVPYCTGSLDGNAILILLNNRLLAGEYLLAVAEAIDDSVGRSCGGSLADHGLEKGVGGFSRINN